MKKITEKQNHPSTSKYIDPTVKIHYSATVEDKRRFCTLVLSYLSEVVQPFLLELITTKVMAETKLSLKEKKWSLHAMTALVTGGTRGLGFCFL